ncbi:LptF/LptG family permease [Cylindrospermopsis raciborskii]|uniref:LptF/LptG family permease n=1 Tax=Cylindrospermopsis raciborskii TaxID=77022 RepID=UPI001BA76BC5|nr:LptF/LptG family permease [Cylindrospermopsis raciborskii]
MKKINIFCQLSLLDKYLVSEIIPALVFNIIIVTIVTESIGISFEQFNFLLNEQISFNDLIYLHILKLPEFVVISVPISILMTTILVYNKLSITSEIIALQSFGVSLYKLILPSLSLSIITGLILFFSSDLIVPYSNHQAAIALESVMNINRERLDNNDIIYKELAQTSKGDLSNKYKFIKYLFYAEKLTDHKMINPTLLISDSQGLKIIINSQIALIYGQSKCLHFYNGVKNIINQDGSFGKEQVFEQIVIDSPNICQQFQLDREKLDDREMNILQIYQRLIVSNKLGDMNKIINLKITLFNRFNLPISCVIFTLLGSSIGINMRPKIKYSSFSLTLLIIGAIKVFEAIINALIIQRYVPVFAIFSPNILGLGISLYLLSRR